MGVRLKSTPDKLNGWDYTAEAAYEVGEVFQTDRSSRQFDLNAFALHLSGGYTAKEVP